MLRYIMGLIMGWDKDVAIKEPVEPVPSPPLQKPEIKPIQQAQTFNFPRYHQEVLIHKFNVYLTKKNEEYRLLYQDDKQYKQHERPRMDEIGCCWGLSLLWAYKNAHHEVDWLYKLVRKIIQCPDQNILDEEIAIEKLLAHIQWLQSPYKYLKDSSFNYKRDVQQDDIHTLLDLNKPKVLNEKISNDRDFKALLKAHAPNNEMILISSMFGTIEKNHAVAVARTGKDFLLYNPNYVTGRAKLITKNRSLVKELKECFYPHLGLKAPRVIPVKINISQAISPIMMAKPNTDQSIAHTSTLFKPVKKRKINSSEVLPTNQKEANMRLNKHRKS